MRHHRTRLRVWTGLLALLVGAIGGCSPEPPQPKAVAPSATSVLDAGAGDVAQPPRRIATH